MPELVTRTVDALPPAPGDLTHVATCGSGDEGNRNHAWSAHCPLCMYRYGFNNGVNTTRSASGTVYADGSRLTIDDRGRVVIDSA